MTQSRTEAPPGYHYWVLLGLVVAAVVPRWLYIQRISLFFDEFTTLWAAKTILQRGLPLFPSGNFYTHGLLFTYLEAPFLWALGMDETLLRLPSLAISVGTVVAVYAVGRRLFSAEAGLIAAAGAAMDPEAIAWGGRVRMYGLLALLVLLAVDAFYQGAIANDRPGRRWLALALLVAAMFTHVEAALFLPALALALVVARGVRWSLRPSVVGPFLLGAAGFLVAVFGLNLGRASHLEAINEVRPYLALPTSDLLGGLRSFAPAFLDLWRLPFTLLVLAGLVLLVRNWDRRSPLVYLYLILFVTLGALLFLAGPTWQTPRYAFMLLPLFWLIAGAVLAHLVLVLASAPLVLTVVQCRPRRGRESEGRESDTSSRRGAATTEMQRVRRGAGWWRAVAAVAAVVVAVWVGVVGYRTAFTQEWGYDKAYRYLQQRWQPGDVVLTTNPAACALYLPECGYYALQFGYEEYVMPGPNGASADRWVAMPLLDNVEQLREVLSTAPRVWLVVDGWRFQSRFDNAFIRTVLDQMAPVFTERGMAVFQGEGFAQRPAPALSWPVHAEFDRELAVEGVELSPAALQPGGELEVSLLWRALDAPRAAYTVFLHLLGPDGQRVAQIDELLLGGFYQPTVWPQDGVVLDRHRLQVPADLAPGRYRLEMGLYPPEGAGALLPVDGGSDRAVLGFLTTEGWLLPASQTPTDADFGLIRLLGYTSDCDLQASACTVRLHWQSTQEVGADYAVFVHLVTEDGRIIAQHDGTPEGGFYPTSAWAVGEVVVDEHRLDLAAERAPGDYRLLVGLYRPDTAERLPVLGADGRPVGDHVVLTTIPYPGD